MAKSPQLASLTQSSNYLPPILLRFSNNVKVVIHDDGSLSEDDEKILTKHIVGLKVIMLKNLENVLY